MPNATREPKPGRALGFFPKLRVDMLLSRRRCWDRVKGELPSYSGLQVWGFEAYDLDRVRRLQNIAVVPNLIWNKSDLFPPLPG